MTADAALAFQDRLRAAALALVNKPEDRASRHELDLLLAYGEGARALLETVVKDLTQCRRLDRRGEIILRAYAERRARMSTGDLKNDPFLTDLGFAPAGHDDVTMFRDEKTAIQSTASDGSEAEQINTNTIPLESGDQIDDRYTIRDLIGVGGMSLIYRAQDERLLRLVAIKVLKTAFIDQPGAIAAFEREAKHAATINHPSIVKIFGSGRQRQHPYIVMEFLEGQPLSRVLKQSHEKPFRWPVVRTMVRAVGSALAATHQKGIVHCDIKPGNIFLLKNGGYRVLDFGIARGYANERTLVTAASGEPDGGQSPDGFAALTPIYASYEMLTGQPPDPRDDIFSLAIIVYQMLAGHHPFDRLPADEARLKHQQLRRPATLPKQMWPTLEAGLSFERADQPASVKQFLTGFRRRIPWFTLAVLSISAILLMAAYLQPAASRALLEQLRQDGRVIGALLEPDAKLIQELDSARRRSDARLDLYVDLLAGPLVERIERLTNVTGASPPDQLDQATAAVKFARETLPRHARLNIWINRVSKALLQRISAALGDIWPISIEVTQIDLAALEIVDPDGFKAFESLLIDILFQRMQALAGDVPRLRALNQASRHLFPDEPWVDPEAPHDKPVLQ